MRLWCTMTSRAPASGNASACRSSRFSRSSGYCDARSLAAIGLLVAGPLRAQERPRRLDEFLTRAIVLDAGQLAAVSRGDVVAKVLPTADDRDVAVFGAVHVAVPRAFFAKWQSNFPSALRTPTRGTVGLFSSPVADADVREIALEPKDLDELRRCKPNDCNFKLPATDMETLRTTIDWSARDAGARVASYVRQRMLAYVTDYRARGNAAMVVYDDLGSVHASDALDAMLRDSSFVFSVVPSLGRHLAVYPRDSLPGAIEVIFWSLDDLPHVRRVLRITHETVFAPPDFPDATIFAAKQIYADHYFEAGLEVLSAVEDAPAARDAKSDGITLVAVRRYRFDHPPRGGLLNIRGRVVGGLRDNVQSDLARLKRESERALRTAGTR